METKVLFLYRVALESLHKKGPEGDEKASHADIRRQVFQAEKTVSAKALGQAHTLWLRDVEQSDKEGESEQSDLG